jgi:hypothetical protein
MIKNAVEIQLKLGYRKLRNHEIEEPNTSPYIIKLIKSRRLRWVGYVVRI